MTQWIGWLELVAEQAVLAVALLVVFTGCRRIARDGLTRGAAAMVAVALVVPVADAWLSLNVMKSVQALQADKMAAIALHGREPAGGWEKAASSPEARSAMSSDAATVAYLFGHEFEPANPLSHRDAPSAFLEARLSGAFSPDGGMRARGPRGPAGGLSGPRPP